jgi:hypothetical protein
VPGLNSDHTSADPEPDPFNPVPDLPANQTGTVWAAEAQDAGVSNQPNLAQVPVTHWFNGQPAVPSGEPYARAQQAMQERMMVDHMVINTVPDSIRLYQHASEGMETQWIIGRAPREAGQTLDGPLGALANGRNGYDQVNLPNEVYTGAPENVGRYRLGVKSNMFGLYESPIGKFGQDALLHSYTGLQPAFPVDKTPMTNTAPYTPNSTGTSHWFPTAPTQVPSLFGLPSETAVTDYRTADAVTDSGFEDRSGGFY